jgi:hypothetical protein
VLHEHQADGRREAADERGRHKHTTPGQSAHEVTAQSARLFTAARLRSLTEPTEERWQCDAARRADRESEEEACPGKETRLQHCELGRVPRNK